MGRCIALVVAGGRGSRFGGDLPKQYHLLRGQPVIRHALKAFGEHPGVAAVRPVIHPDDTSLFAAAAQGLDVLEPVFGGSSRQESVLNGLESLLSQTPKTVLIHDAARPDVDSEIISQVIKALKTHPGAIPALPIADTLKHGRNGLSVGTVDRDGLWRAQTPQGFCFKDILQAHRQAAGAELTDDAAVAERAGLSVALVPGSEENQKVSTSKDLLRAERRQAKETRIGSGFDVHRIERPGDGVTLCGVKIPCDFNLKGHSDADVALHALTDALMGAVGAGDIGMHFPASDERWLDADSCLFLEKAAQFVRQRQGQIINLDLTIICEHPKIDPHRALMASRLADILGLELGRISIKGTTTEKLGFTGRGEGIAVQAVAAVSLPYPPADT